MRLPLATALSRARLDAELEAWEDDISLSETSDTESLMLLDDREDERLSGFRRLTAPDFLRLVDAGVRGSSSSGARGPSGTSRSRLGQSPVLLQPSCLCFLSLGSFLYKQPSLLSPGEEGRE